MSSGPGSTSNEQLPQGVKGVQRNPKKSNAKTKGNEKEHFKKTDPMKNVTTSAPRLGSTFDGDEDWVDVGSSR